jgi:hypothetical protein
MRRLIELTNSYMKTKAATIALPVLVWLVVSSVSVLGLPDNPSRAESEKVIRKAAHDMMKAFLTQDVAVFKRHSARRTLELVSLVYEAARRDPTYQQELQKARITNADQFLGYFLLGMANQYLQAVPLSPEAAAIKISKESTVTFITDSEARIAIAGSGFARARQAAGSWKLDLTDWLKTSVLKEIKEPELRARIQKL